jgi:hypothetical protein
MKKPQNIYITLNVLSIPLYVAGLLRGGKMSKIISISEEITKKLDFVRSGTYGMSYSQAIGQTFMDLEAMKKDVGELNKVYQRTLAELKTLKGEFK